MKDNKTDTKRNNKKKKKKLSDKTMKMKNEIEKKNVLREMFCVVKERMIGKPLG